MSDVTTEFLLHSDGTGAVKRSQEVTAILEDAKARQSSGLVGSADYWHMAEFPAVLVEKYCNDQGITYAEFMQDEVHIRRMVNDPALSGFRVHGGRM